MTCVLNKLMMMMEELSNFAGAVVPDADYGSLFHFPHHCRIGFFRRFISISHSHRQIFTKTCKMNDVTIMNLKHFGSDPADVRIRINPEMRIRIPDLILALAEVCTA